MKHNAKNTMKASAKIAVVTALTATGLVGGWWLMGKSSRSTDGQMSVPGAVAETQVREDSAKTAIREYQAWRQTQVAKPSSDTQSSRPPHLSVTEQKYLEALSWISKKALKSDTEVTDFKASWRDPAFLDSLGRGLNHHEISADGTMPVSMLTTSLLISAINNPATLDAAEQVVLKHLSESRIEDLQKNQNKEAVLKVAENQGELLFHWSAQAKNAEAKLRDLERKSPSAARRAILSNVDREHRNNLSMSALEMKSGQ